ncbi:polysaccharide biosynthesis/export family protein [Rhodobacter sp. 24-YEA-8]|uniref:polysaccharide biosynthesis/export family protein n=1 Tax=Rhodobacter sp. 24-YEA-8 TaxID=1884310 RepID=UPI00089AA158|nr:polysaccharide biosynthesis/export family protein [Rhodobacter sp. 24-YEA-8]SED90422.1 polysaccharide export outer membrane protein [Rhodobacter sp. 24-YEA-8]
MRNPPLLATLMAGLALSLAGCGIAYQSTSIREGVVDGTKVRVIGLTPETTLAANQQAYSPRALPAAFSATAGTHGTMARGLPQPANLPEQRQGVPATRLPPAVAATPYQVGVGDVVLLATKAPANSVAELSGLLAAQNNRQGYTVQDDGAIAIPDVGRVRIAGMTLEDAEAAVFQRLVERQMDPSFSLEVAEFNARKVPIGGAVAKPGVAPVTLTPLTLDTALAAVGGIAAPDRESAVIRIYRAGSLYEIPVTEFLRNQSYQKTRLLDGDTVFVDSDYDLTRAEAYFSEQLALQGARSSAITALSQEVGIRRSELEEQRANFNTRLELGAEKRDYVYLTGEVGKQGRWALPYDQSASLADALFDQGGIIAKTGNPRQIYVLRGSADPREFGALTAWHLDAGAAAGLMLATRFEMRPNDVVYIAQQPVTKWDRVISQITPSLITVPLNNLTEN